MPFANKAQLIAYPDSLGGNLRNLRENVERFFSGCFQGGIHVLPPFPSSGDRGFAPITYDEIDPRFGSWDDIAALAAVGPVMLDLMANHISKHSAYFIDYLDKGASSCYADLFIGLEKIWPDGKPNEGDIAKIFLRRPRPYSEYKTRSGETIRVWTTFGHEDPSEQIDLDLEAPPAMRMLTDTMASLRERGVSALRLDAIGYAVKRMGTSCFFVEPEIWDLLGRIRAAADSIGVDLLPEVHAPLEIQRKLAAHGYWGYDFALPFLVLDALMNKKSASLVRYLRDRPQKLVTTLDCHDGIPVKPDLDGLVDESEARKVVDACIARGANVSRVYSEAHKSGDGFDVHQIRCSYYSALGCDDEAYIAARAIQLFVPGIPQVYYVGLLAGENDSEGAKKSGEGRDLNRRNYTNAEVEAAAGKPAVRRLARLLKFRNESRAFEGLASFDASSERSLTIRWRSGECYAELSIDLAAPSARVASRDADGIERRWQA
jgi:sucrose 6(F)-phosphate phosphorylase